MHLTTVLRYCRKGSFAPCLTAASKSCLFFLTAVIFTEEFGTYRNTKALQEFKVLALESTNSKPKKACETKRVGLLQCVTSQLSEAKVYAVLCCFPVEQIWNNCKDLSTLQ